MAFAVIPDPVDAPGNRETVGIDRGVAITAAVSGGQTLNCPQLSVKERAKLREHQRRASRTRNGGPRCEAEQAKAARRKAKDADRRKDSRPRFSPGAGGMTRRSLRASVNPSNANSP